MGGEDAPCATNGYRTYIPPFRLQSPSQCLQGFFGRRPQFLTSLPFRHVGHDMRDLVVLAAMMLLNLEADENSGPPPRVSSQIATARASVSSCLAAARVLSMGPRVSGDL